MQLLAQITDAGLTESVNIICNMIQLVALAWIAGRLPSPRHPARSTDQEGPSNDTTPPMHGPNN